MLSGTKQLIPNKIYSDIRCNLNLNLKIHIISIILITSISKYFYNIEQISSINFSLQEFKVEV